MSYSRAEEDGFRNLGQCLRKCGNSVAESWRSATTMLQDQADYLDPTCACKRVCDKNQLIVPLFVAEDEVQYAKYEVADSGAQGSSSSPLSPRMLTNLASSASSSSSTPFHIDNRKTEVFEFIEPAKQSSPAWQQRLQEDKNNGSRLSSILDDSRDVGWRPLPAPEVPDGYASSYYAEYVPILRPPSTVASTSLVQTSVRAAPWEQWDASKLSRPGVSQRNTSPATQALRALKAASRENEPDEPTAQGSSRPHSPQRAHQVTTRDAATDTREWDASTAELSARDQRPAVMMASHGIPPVPPTPPEALGVSNLPVGLRQEHGSTVGSAWASSWLTAATSWFTGETSAVDVPTYPGNLAPASRTLPVEEAKQHVTSSTPSQEPKQQTARQSPHAASNVSTPTDDMVPDEEVAPPQRKEPPAKANATKSVLSMNSGFQSSAAMALGALSMGNAPRRGKADGRTDISSVVEESSGMQENAPNASPLHKHSTGTVNRGGPLHRHSTGKAAASQPSENDLAASQAKPERRQPGQTKSVLSQSSGLQSSSAMVLGSLMNKGTASRRGDNAEKGDLQSVLPGGAKGSSSGIGTVKAQPQQQEEPEFASNAGTSVANSKTAESTTAKPRRKGPDAKSVISGLGSSSSAASSLLGPMLQGGPKRRQKGGDMASVVE